ncbi:MAG: hypothetical protein U0802_26285 [Candidatus Binatia bacterium]
MRCWGRRALLALAGGAAALLALEAGLRLFPPRDLPLNDPYQLTRLVGTRQFRVPFSTYREIYPLAFDHDGYYARSDGAVDYHLDQLGGRWIEPRPRDVDGPVALVVGDSFTFGFGLRYEDAYIFRTEQALQAAGRPRHFVNLAEPGVDAQGSLRNYRALRDRQPHDLLLFGLHLNDLVAFPTSLVAMTAWQARAAESPSRLLAFVAKTLAERADRAAKVRDLVDPAQLQKPYFRDNLAAIEAMRDDCAAHGRRFAVVLLPILVDLDAGTFAPLYAAVRDALASRGIAVIDLSASLPPAPDASYWILPFDQHPNERANAAFARALAAALLATPAGHAAIGGRRFCGVGRAEARPLRASGASRRPAGSLLHRLKRLVSASLD